MIQVTSDGFLIRKVNPLVASWKAAKIVGRYGDDPWGKALASAAIPGGASRAEPKPEVVQPADVGQAIFFLCSDAASAITGVTLPIDCGWLATSAYTSYAAVPA